MGANELTHALYCAFIDCGKWSTKKYTAVVCYRKIKPNVPHLGLVNPMDQYRDTYGDCDGMELGPSLCPYLYLKTKRNRYIMTPYNGKYYTSVTAGIEWAEPHKVNRCHNPYTSADYQPR